MSVVIEAMAKAMFESDPAFTDSEGKQRIRWEDVALSNGPYWRSKARAALYALKDTPLPEHAFKAGERIVEDGVEWPAARIVHELVLDGGSVRIDLASVGDEALRLIELKSERDVLDRLPKQMAAAQECAQEAWVAVDGKHLDKVEALMSDRGDVDWWRCGLLVLRDGVLSERRQSYPGTPDPRRVVGLLWSDEMRTHLIASNNQVNMIALAVGEYGLRHIMRKVCAALKARPFPRADEAVGQASPGRLFV